MAQDFIANVRPDFPLEQFTEKLMQIYTSKGYTVNNVTLNGGYMLILDKGLGGANTILGLGTGIKVTLYISGSILTVSYSDEEWTSKIIALGIGLFLSGFVLPFALAITGAIGTVNQYNLSKDISNDVKFLLSTIYK